MRAEIATITDKGNLIRRLNAARFVMVPEWLCMSLQCLQPGTQVLNLFIAEARVGRHRRGIALQHVRRWFAKRFDQVVVISDKGYLLAITGDDTLTAPEAF